ncbi:MAG: Uncharacterized protein G01um101416_278 [Microgenomates group bacterium Gr01-1014_16]|nr:MAG: Uncharacterized protein G01um101416_278 [Microgenomates group bacterium Gr01-1014_16]
MVKRVSLALVTLLLCYFVALSLVRAEECDNPGGLTDAVKIGQCIGKYSGILDAIAKANATNAKELEGLRVQVAGLKNQISNLDKQLDKLSKDIFEREVKIGVKEELLAAKIRQDYVRRREQPMLLVLLSSGTAEKFFRDAGYRERLAANDREVISGISREINDLNVQSSMLNVQKKNLDGLRVRVDKQATFLAGEVAKADRYVTDLGGKIAALSARQQELLAERTGVFSTTVGDVPLADDPASRPDYNPGFSPAFAVFSFGAPHFRGMSQYGAFGRAKAGQNVEQILRAYYGEISLDKVYRTDINISVRGYGTVDIETYVKRIYEMPGSWGDEGGMEALKAQAVAARSYALAYTNNGAGSICATEACQVYKPANKGGRWEEAVNATRGWVLVAGGKSFSSWYASTSGGYQQAYSASGHSTPGFWDTTSDWTKWADGAWEVKAKSPWFYKGWYKSRSGKTCGRSHPWLRTEEMADVVNAVIIVAGGGDTSGILPEDGCTGTAGWSKGKMAEEAGKYGGNVTNVTNISIKHGSNGQTNQVVFSTNRGEVNISGANFYKAFNLRAPGMLSLKSYLFNIEKK